MVNKPMVIIGPVLIIGGKMSFFWGGGGVLMRGGRWVGRAGWRSGQKGNILFFFFF